MAPPVAEADGPELAGRIGTGAEVVGRGHEVLARLGLVQRREQLARLVLGARIPAKREQRVGRKGHVVVERDPPRDVLDVRVQPAVLVHDQHRRQLARRLGRPHQIPAHLLVALGRRVLHVRRRQPRVVFGDLLRLGELRVQRVEHHRRGHAADGVLAGLVEEATAVERAVDVGVKQDQQFGIEISRGLHRRPSGW